MYHTHLFFYANHVMGQVVNLDGSTYDISIGSKLRIDDGTSQTQSWVVPPNTNKLAFGLNDYLVDTERLSSVLVKKTIISRHKDEHQELFLELLSDNPDFWAHRSADLMHLSFENIGKTPDFKAPPYAYTRVGPDFTWKVDRVGKGYKWTVTKSSLTNWSELIASTVLSTPNKADWVSEATLKFQYV